MQDGNDLKRGRFWPVNNGVVGISAQCPEAERARREVGSGVAAQRAVSEERTSIIDRLFYTVGGVLAVLGNVRPNIENIRSSERRENVTTHPRGKRPSRQFFFIA